MDNASVVQRNRALQTEWYGEPLGERFRRLLARLTLSQAQLADVLGLSAPMVSQLMTGARAKISNPAVLARLAVLDELAADPAFLARPPQDRAAELARLAAESPAAGSASTSTRAIRADQAPAVPRADPAVAVQSVLRAVATAGELEEAARLLDAGHPGLAEVLRVYGTMRTADARAHYERTVTP
ncbi:helix-turn-helix domain-containing protein [Catenulispora subtropica]|uniref:DNA-binding protein n=1 Tax=Catenulispora subtropica TaxID=450798 RepID=A0ABN2S4R2_9ACTN